MPVKAGACSGSCAGASAFGGVEGSFLTIKGCDGAVFTAAGTLKAVASFSAPAALAGVDGLSPGPSAITAAEGLEEEGTELGALKTCSGGCTTASAAEGVRAGGSEAVPVSAGAVECGTSCLDCILVQPK